MSRRPGDGVADAIGDEDVQQFRGADPVENCLAGLARPASNTGAGNVSPAETAIRSDDRSAPLSIAAIIARYAVGEVKQIVAL